MRRFIIGLVTGVAVTGGVILVPWGESGVPGELDSVLQANPAASSERSTDIEPFSDESALLEQRQRTPVPAESTQASAVEHVEQGETRSTNPTAESREGISSFHERLERRALDAEEAMQAEAVDVEWAQRMQTEFWNYLYQKPDLHEFGSLQVDCRSTWCEVKFLSYGELVPDVMALLRFLQEGANEAFWTERWSVIGARTDHEHGQAAASVFVRNSGSSSHQFALMASGVR